MQNAQGPGVCKLPKPPASRALCQAKRAQKWPWCSTKVDVPCEWQSGALPRCGRASRLHRGGWGPRGGVWVSVRRLWVLLQPGIAARVVLPPALAREEWPPIASRTRVFPCGSKADGLVPSAPSMGFSRQEYWSGVPLPSPNKEHMGRGLWACEEGPYFSFSPFT